MRRVMPREARKMMRKEMEQTVPAMTAFSSIVNKRQANNKGKPGRGLSNPVTDNDPMDNGMGDY